MAIKYQQKYKSRKQSGRILRDGLNTPDSSLAGQYFPQDLETLGYELEQTARANPNEPRMCGSCRKDISRWVLGAIK